MVCALGKFAMSHPDYQIRNGILYLGLSGMLTYLSQKKQRYQAFAGQVTIPSLEHPAAPLRFL